MTSVIKFIYISVDIDYVIFGTTIVNSNFYVFISFGSQRGVYSPNILYD